jgi:exosortase F-associated protein
MEKITLVRLLRPKKISLVVAAIFLLGSVYVFQRLSFLQLLDLSFQSDSNIPFIINRTIRLIVNDLACFILIYALFEEKKYLRVAFVIFLIELFILLPTYLIVKLSVEGNSEISSPLLSQIHRLIVNPTLMFLLIIAFFYQRLTASRR